MIRKKIFALGVAAVLLAVGTGCSVKEAENPGQDKAPAIAESSKIDEAIQPYGRLVEVQGKKMNLLVVGEGKGKETIVWIPGYGDIAPGLSYTKMLEELAPNYRVIVVEPFGYGLSDVTDAPRTLENITEEIHEAIHQVEDLDQYILMGHSISGIYGMKYISSYPEEVTAFIGLDSSTPNMLDGMQMVVDQSEEDADFIPQIPEVSEEINQEYQKIYKKNSGNKNLADESDRMNENFEKSKQHAFPEDLPVAFFLATQSIEDQKLSFTENKDWVKMHADLVKESAYSKIYEIDGEHMLYLEKYQEIAEKIHEFLNNR